MPRHCFGKRSLPYESPLIAYVKNGNEIEADVVASMESLFETQRNLKVLVESAGDDNDLQFSDQLFLFLGFDKISRDVLI